MAPFDCTWKMSLGYGWRWGALGKGREMESWGRSQDHLDRMDIEWFWFLLSRGPIFPFYNGGQTGGPWKTLSLQPKSGSPLRWLVLSPPL